MEDSEGVCYDDPTRHQAAAYNLGDLKREEETLISLYSKMKDQLHKLEVEELELKQKIRRKECNEAPEELFPPPPLPSVTSDAENQSKKRSTKGKGRKQKQNRDRTASTSHDETASEMDESMSVTSALSQPSPARSSRTTPNSVRRSPRRAKGSPAKLKAARNLTIPSFEPEKMTAELDLTALNSFTLPSNFQQSEHFVESEDD